MSFVYLLEICELYLFSGLMRRNSPKLNMKIIYKALVSINLTYRSKQYRYNNEMVLSISVVIWSQSA